jgi:hypothetical protein
MAIELMLCAIGLFLAQWINYGFGSNATRVAYEFPIFFQLTMLVATFVVVPFLPESPRWLVATGQMDKAAASLVRLGEKGMTASSPEIEKTMIEMEEIARLEAISGLDWFKSIVSRPARS